MAYRDLKAGRSYLACGVSPLVLALVAGVLPSSAWAQGQSTAPGTAESAGTPASDNAAATNIEQSSSTSTTPNTDEEAAAADQSGEEEIIVTGSRRALQTSQNIKRNADTFVDSITATDIGAFPDKSVAEALQRVPGVTVSRFAAPDDTSHFSADPQAILVRGLSQVRTEINGRDQFSANSSRGLGFGDISPDLLAGVDTYKNQTADLIEGGIAATVNLRTRVPFDQRGQVINITGNLNYGDKSKKVTPEISGLYSQRFDTEAGEFGILAAGAYSDLLTNSEAINYGRTAVFDGVYGPGLQYIPESVAFRDVLYDRQRIGINLAGQWRSPDEKLLATVQYNRSQYDEAWRERGVISYLTEPFFGIPAEFIFREGGPLAARIPRAAPGSPAFTFNEEGLFQTGVIVNQQTDFTWWGGADVPNPTGQFGGEIGVNNLGQPMFNSCYSWGNALGPPGSCGPDARGPDLNAVTRYNQSERMVQDLSFNVKWEPTDRIGLNFDAQYVDATTENYDLEVGQYSFANVFLDTTGSRPRTELTAPTNIRLGRDGLADPNSYRYNHVMDHIEDSEGEELAFRIDGTYDFETDWLNSLKVGVRYADRDQTVRNSAYNWGNIANRWGNLDSGQAAFYNIDRTTPTPAVPEVVFVPGRDATATSPAVPPVFAQSALPAFPGYPTGLYDVRTFGNSFFGSRRDYVFANFDAMESRAFNGLSRSALGVGQDGWNPVCSNGGTSQTGPRVNEIDGTCFTQGELNTVSEQTMAAYAMLRFGGPNTQVAGVGVSGNIGVRYIRTEVKSDGAQVYNSPFVLATPAQCTGPLPPAVPGQPAPQRPVTCFLSADDIAFANGGSVLSTVESKFDNWLPSFNLKLDLSDKWLVRFAASRAISRPDIGQLQNFFQTFATLPGNAGDNDPRIVRDAQGNPTGVNPIYLANARNPNLKPIRATQFDLSIENYFAAVGSFTLTGFYKKFDDYIQTGEYNRDITFNGVTRTVNVRGPINGEGAKLYGAEVAFQRYFDFLPRPFQGLGIQTNATYVKNNGVQNPNGIVSGASTTLPVDQIEGLSKYAFNVTGLYDSGPLGMRVAYNWRSKFLIAAVDCCTFLPNYQQAAGYLDASVRYALTANFELSLQAQNLLNTETKVRQQVTAAGGEVEEITVPAGWLTSDRRFIFGVRAKF